MAKPGRPRTRPWAPVERPLHLGELSPRQFEVVELLVQGLTLKEVAQRLGISFHTAKNRLSLATERLGLDPNRNLRVQLAKLYWLDTMLKERVRHWVETFERGL